MQNSSTLAPLVYRKERIYYGVMLAVSLLVYAGLAMMAVTSPASGGVVVGYGLFIAVMLFFIHGMVLGHLRGNGVRITSRQFPELHAVAMRHAATLGLDGLPDMYLVESAGVMNAFATRFMGRNFVVINSAVLAMAEAQGADAVSFIVGHELGHVRRGHLKRRWLIAPARVIPYLGAAYSRACEYTCDRFGAHCEPNGAIRGLVALAAGPDLYRKVNVQEYANQVETEKGFWVRRAELMSTHPRLPKRVAALIAAGVPLPGVAAPAGASPVGIGAHAAPTTYAS